MANTVQHKRGTTAQVNSYTGAVGEFIYNTTTKRIHAQDGATAGGIPHALVSDVDLKANASVTISAGAGLTGGGTLAANRTLALSSTSLASLSLADSAVQSVNGKTGSSVTLTKADVGLGSVDNTSDANKPISTATQTALNAKADSSITITAGAGLTGGGDLSANRTVALDAASIASLSKADTALQAPGGTTGQILAKNSGADNDVAWVSSEAATAVSYGPQTLTEAQQVQARQNIQADKSYDSIASVAAATVPAFANAIRTNGYYAAGDGGGALYKRVSLEPSHLGKVQSADGSWWEIAETEVYLRQVGAVDNSDITPILQDSVDLGRNIVVDGVYLVTDKISHNGHLNIRGLDDKSELHWPASASDGGISITPQSWYDYIEVKGVRLTTASVALWNAISVDWYHLGTTDIPYFWVRCRILANRIMGALTAGGDNDTSVGWLNGVYLNYPFSVEVMDNYIFGAWDGSYVTNGVDAFKTNAGIYVPDQSQRTLAYLRMERNSIFYAKAGVRQYNIEGTWFIDNDIQVTWYGLRYENTIATVNQHRIYGNHIGVYDAQIYIINARQVLIENNEISYRFGRTGGVAVSLIALDGVYSGSIVGNSIRGNVSSTTDVNLTGVLLISNARPIGNTRRISIDANQFQNLGYAIAIRATANGNTIGPSNSYDNIMNAEPFQTVDNSAISPGRMGSGTEPIVGGQNPALYLANKSAAALGVGREVTNGAAVGFFRGGSLVGNIAVNDTATSYNTSSDATLKIDRGTLSVEDAVAILQLVVIHDFEWNATGKRDFGVFAQELYEVYPQAVTKGGWFLEDGSEVEEGVDGANYIPWAVDYSKLIPVMFRVLQGVLTDEI